MCRKSFKNPKDCIDILTLISSVAVKTTITTLYQLTLHDVITSSSAIVRNTMIIIIIYLEIEKLFLSHGPILPHLPLTVE